jgi:Ca2+-transporting ATPase
MKRQFSAVYRDGRVIRVDSREIVPGDLVYLTAGDRVPADGILAHSAGLMVDESMLTGESMGVLKSEYSGKNDTGKENRLYQGTTITQGSGKFLAIATGIQTEYGKLGRLLENISQQKTPLQIKMRSMVRALAILAISIAFLVGFYLAIIFSSFIAPTMYDF